jgi:3-phosphoshikimate 1-carboxyvinyltransferase
MLDILHVAGCHVERHRRWVRISGRAHTPFTVALDDAPDLYPIVGALAASIPGRSSLLGGSHVALKESDRRRGTAELARRLGATTRLSRRRLEIRGTDRPRALRAYGSTDHRMVASAAVACLGARGPSRFTHPEAVQKSYPGLWRDLRALGANIVEVR